MSAPLLFQVFDHSNPLTFISMHSQPYFMSPNSLVSFTYPWKFLKVNSSSLSHKFKLTPSQFAQRLPRFLSTFTTLYLSKLTWPTPSTTFLALPLPHLLSPYSMPTFSGILLHLQHASPLYIYMLVSTFLPQTTYKCQTQLFAQEKPYNTCTT